MKGIHLASVAVMGLVACTEEEPSGITPITPNSDVANMIDIKERLRVCTSRGEHLVRVPDQIGGGPNYFACAENSWDCVPVTVYERTGRGYSMAYLINENGYVIVDHGRQTNWDRRRNNQHKCIPPRRR